jgi:hypothetical protein
VRPIPKSLFPLIFFWISKKIPTLKIVAFFRLLKHIIFYQSAVNFNFGSFLKSSGFLKPLKSCHMILNQNLPIFCFCFVFDYVGLVGLDQ